MRIVYDASALLDLLPDRPRRKWAAPLYRHLRPRHPIVLPSLIVWEIAEALRRRPVPEVTDAVAYRQETVERLLRSARLAPPDPEHRHSVAKIALSEGLTAYDAAYLAVAAHHPDTVLVTEDDRLREAGRAVLGAGRSVGARELLARLGLRKP